MRPSPPMRLIALTLTLTPLLGACAMFNSVTSVTTIEPNNAIRLGGGQIRRILLPGTRDAEAPCWTSIRLRDMVSC